MAFDAPNHGNSPAMRLNGVLRGLLFSGKE